MLPFNLVDACGCACACAAGDAAPMEVDERRLEVALLLPSTVHTTAQATTTATNGKVEKDVVGFTPRQCLLWGLLCVFLFGCMMKYTHGSIWFSAFSVILMAIPMTEFFIIYGTMNSDEQPPSPPDAEAGEQLVPSLEYNCTTTNARTEARDKMIRCFLRGLLLLVWLFMINLTRRAFNDEFGKIKPFDILALIFSVTMLSGGFCMGCLMIEGVA